MTRRFPDIHRLIPSLLAAVTLFLVPLFSRAQGDALMTQYWAVPTYYNPGAIGDTDYLRIRGGGRLQWVGIDNAPQTFLAAADMPFKFLNKRFGTGLVMQQESYGLFKNLTINAQIGYKQKLFKGELTAALSVGFINQQFMGSEVFIPDDDDFHTPEDEAIPTRDVAGNALDLGIGIYYTHKKFWAGLSLLHANNPTVTFTSDTEGSSVSRADDISGGDGSNPSAGLTKKYQFTANRTAYFMAGSNIPIKNTLIEILPSVLVRSNFTFTTGELTARVRLRKFLSFGLGYRWDDAVIATIGAEIKNFYVGYSYDYATSAIHSASSGSHEFFVGYSMKLDLSDKNKNRHKSVRIM